MSYTKSVGVVGVRHLAAVAVMCLMAVLCAASASAPPANRPLSSMPNAQVIGTVQATFEIDTKTYKYNPIGIYEAAYVALVAAAGEKYQGNIDIADITWAQGKKIKGKVYEYSASGKVVSLGGNARNASASGVEGALEQASKAVLKNVAARSKLAIVYITAQDRGTTDYIAGELEYMWVNQGYFISDRSQLDKLRSERKFQMSDEVDEATAISIGKYVGADIIITGRIDGEGSLRRLRLTALNTQTAQVVGSASERL